jgi:predicted dienelactone hydrolase
MRKFINLSIPFLQVQKILGWLSSFAGGIVIAVGSAQAAERIELRFGGIEFGVNVKELESFAKEGIIGSELDFFLSRVSESDRKYVRELLTLRTGFTPLQVSQFFYSSVGEKILGYMGGLVQIGNNLSGAKAIRVGLYLSAADSEGLTLLNFLQKFPSSTMLLDAGKGLEVAEKIGNLGRTTEKTIVGIEQLSIQLAKSEPRTELKKLESLIGNGKYEVKLQTENLKDLNRDRKFTVDIYLPQAAPKPLPVLVFSHGLASDRQHFATLANFLASHGFVAVSVEHPGSNTLKFQNLLRGLTKELFDVSEFVDRPKDISYVLDHLDRRFSGEVNLQNVGVIGHSFGGYTALALAGATIDFDYLTKECSPGIDSANISLILQCEALKLPRQSYDFRDQRINFALAINPIDSSVFGPKGMAKIQIPVAIAASSDDPVASALLEQIKPFSWMTAPQRYLFVVRGVGHAVDIRSLIAAFVPSVESFIPAKNIEPLKAYSRSFILALVQTHLANRSDYLPLLQSSYAIAASEAPNKVSVIRKLSPEQFNNIVQ